MVGVRVIRDGTIVIVEHDCEPIVAVRLELGVRASTLSDREILDRYNQRVLALGAALIATPQLQRDDVTGRWRPSGRAIRCVVEGSVDEPTVFVDDVELSFAELGALMSNHGAPIFLVFLDD